MRGRRHLEKQIMWLNRQALVTRLNSRSSLSAIAPTWALGNVLFPVWAASIRLLGNVALTYLRARNVAKFASKTLTVPIALVCLAPS